jgi:hypothetical protein
MTDPPIRSNGRIICVLVTVFWGDWHREMFLNANLPTMLASGNLPALTVGIECDYLVYTTAEDAAKIEGNLAFARLQSLLPVTVSLFKPSKTKNPITLHHDIWRQAMEHARRRGAFILLMPPDVAWADGSFARLGAALEAGKRAIFMAYPRVLSETFVAAMMEGFQPASDQSLTIPALEMMKLTIAHLHPMMAAYGRSSDLFPIHPELVLWPVRGDGFLIRLLARELFCFEAARYPMNAEALLDTLPPVEDIHVFCDSRQFLGVSFTRLLQDAHWYFRSRQLEPLSAARWWINYDSPVNDFISTFDLRFTCGTADESRWRATERQAGNLLLHLRSAREFLRVEFTLRQMQLWRAAVFLASALSLYGIARRWPHRGPFVVLAPTDKAIRNAGLTDKLEELGSAAGALLIIEAHVAALPVPDTNPQGLELTTLAGQRFRLEPNAVVRRCGGNFVVPISTVLYDENHAGSKAMPTARNGLNTYLPRNSVSSDAI